MTKIIKISPGDPEPEKIEEAAAILKAGGVIAFPTETFYGLGADARNEKAIDRIFAIKGRDFKNPILLVIGDRKGLEGIADEVPESALKLMDRFWPGPLTILFKARPSVSPKLTAGSGKIGVRVSPHPLAKALSLAIGGPLTATSANRSGAAECSTADDVIVQLGDTLEWAIDGGNTPGGSGSTVIDVTVTPAKVLREGAIRADLIRGTL